MSSKKPLTPKQERFVREYLVDLNATQAAIRAGYSKKTANEQGSRLLAHVSIQEAIAKGTEKKAAKLEVTADRVLRELALIGFCDMADHVDIGSEGEVRVKTFDEMPEGSSRVISGIKEKKRILGSGEGDGNEVIMEATLEYKHHDKVKALELLGKHLGMWTDKTELTGNMIVRINNAAKRKDDKPGNGD